MAVDNEEVFLEQGAKRLNLPPWKRQTIESMESEIAHRSFYDEGEEFPLDDVKKTLEQLNLGDHAGYRYDRQRDAE